MRPVPTVSYLFSFSADLGPLFGGATILNLDFLRFNFPNLRRITWSRPRAGAAPLRFFMILLPGPITFFGFPEIAMLIEFSGGLKGLHGQLVSQRLALSPPRSPAPDV